MLQKMGYVRSSHAPAVLRVLRQSSRHGEGEIAVILFMATARCELHPGKVPIVGNIKCLEVERGPFLCPNAFGRTSHETV